MGELVDRDQEHLRLLMWGYYIIAGSIGVVSLISVLFIAFGAFASVLIPAKQATGEDPQVVAAMFLGAGIAFLVVSAAAALVTYLAGRNLRDRRHRFLCLIVAGLCCLSIPWGTAFGICAIGVLNRPSVKALFDLPRTALPLDPPS